MAKQHNFDIKLVKAAQRGHKAAFDVLMLKYQPKINKIVGRYLNDTADVLDVSQEVFIKAYRALPTFRGDSAFYTWLYRVAINTVKNYTIIRGRRPPDTDIDITDAERQIGRSILKEFGTPENMVMCDELESAVHDAVEELPESLRTAILLREMEGLSYEDIATVMKCPVGTIRSRIFRAREVINHKVESLLL